MSSPTSFTPEIIEKLGYYVYRLIDPRNGETFYVGKGKGNRVFEHANNHLRHENLTENLSLKLERIRQIIFEGFEVQHVIHRHGLSEKSAFEVEAALIDAYAGLSNVVDGHGKERGTKHIKQILELYTAPDLLPHKGHKLLLLNIVRTTDKSMYECTRMAWRASISRVQEADYVLAVSDTIVRGVFIAEKWLPFTPENFPDDYESQFTGRCGFQGKEAPKEIQEMYVGHRYKFKGANPVKYYY